MPSPEDPSTAPDAAPAPTVDDMRRTADRCDELAQTAELMGDDDGAARLRDTALLWRMRAMDLLDGGR